MRRLTFRERHRRMQESMAEAWERGGAEPADPGLREAYAGLPRAPIRLIVPAMGKSINQGGLLRLAEAFRIEAVDLAPEMDLVRDFSGGAGCWDWQPFRWIAPAKAIHEAKANGAKVVGLTLAEGAVPIPAYSWSFPSALVVGEEKHGLEPAVACLCDDRIAIPLFGLMTSINVACACAIALHAAIEALRASDPAFTPARNASRGLLGLDRVRYQP